MGYCCGNAISSRDSSSKRDTSFLMPDFSKITERAGVWVGYILFLVGVFRAGQLYSDINQNLDTIKKTAILADNLIKTQFKIQEDIKSLSQEIYILQEFAAMQNEINEHLQKKLNGACYVN